MSAAAPLVAGVDSSTQSTKVEIRRLDTGEVVASASAPHPGTTPPRSEQDPAAWLQAFETAWAAVGSPEVAAISIAGQQHGMVVLDAEGQVLRPAKLWNDTESAPDAGWLLKQLPDRAEGWANAVGSVPAASFTATKLSWLHRSEPDTWAKLAHVLLPHDWLTSQLARSFTTDRGDASGTGYWSPATGEYRWDLLGVIDRERDWSDVVPRVADPLEVVGTWNGAKVAVGTGDNMGAALGLGVTAGRAVVSLGTSGTAFTVADAPTADASGAVAGFADATGSVPAAGVHAERHQGAERRPPVCSPSIGPGSTRSPPQRPPVRAGSPCCRTSTANARPTCRRPPGCWPACAAT